MIIGVLGASGFLGTNLMNYLSDYGIIAVPGSKSLEGNFQVDATHLQSVIRWIECNNITHIVNLAAICGGIGLNKTSPYTLWRETTMITSSVLDACVIEKIEKVVMIGTVCSYSADSPVPFKEADLMKYGMPEETNRAYGVSKLNGLIGAQAANKEYGLNIINLIPVNMYGPHDHFDLENSHVIPAMINKILSAKENNEHEITVWGDGSASREFLYVEDCASAIHNALVNDVNTSELINIGTGVETSIKELILMLCDIIGFEGKIFWDKSKPNGQMRRCLDITKSKQILDWSPEVNLKDGLIRTIDWYRKHREA